MKFTTTELNQLLSYCFARQEEGWYYGNKEQFEKRHAHIVEALSAELESRCKAITK